MSNQEINAVIEFIQRQIAKNVVIPKRTKNYVLKLITEIGDNILESVGRQAEAKEQQKNI